MADFEDHLRKIRDKWSSRRPAKRRGCLTEEQMSDFLRENPAGILSPRHRSHILLCNRCTALLRQMLQTISDDEQIARLNRRLFPLPEEVDYSRVHAVELFRDFISLRKRDLAPESSTCVFWIREPGNYHLEIETGQVVWGRWISSDQLRFALSHSRPKKVAAKSRRRLVVRRGKTRTLAEVKFEDLALDGHIIVRLVTSRDSAILHCRILKATMPTSA